MLSFQKVLGKEKKNDKDTERKKNDKENGFLMFDSIMENSEKN